MDPQFVFPAYEDAFYYLWRERRLPANVDPLDSRLEDSDGACASGRRSSNKAWARPSGTSCPLHAAQTAQGGKRARGSCAANVVYLIPGDSPIGIDCRSIHSLGSLPATILHPRTGSVAELPTLPRHADIRRSSANTMPCLRRRRSARVREERPPLPKESACRHLAHVMCAETPQRRAVHFHAAGHASSSTISNW